MSAATRPIPTILLIGNYEQDGQASMQRFEALLAEELPKAGQTVERLRPIPFFGRLKPSAHGLGKWLGYLDKFLLFPHQLRRAVRRLRTRAPLLVHICDHSNAPYARLLQGTPHLVTCHDLLAIRSARGEVPQNRTGFTGRVLQGIIAAGLQRTARVACVSTKTREDLRRLLPTTLRQEAVIPMGLNFPYRHLGRARALEHLAERTALPALRALFADHTARYVLHVGGNQWYKNRPGVAAAFLQWRAAHPQTKLQLLLVGKEPNAALRAVVQGHASQGAVHFITGVSGEDLEALYNAAEVLLFPSLEEGFGWPIVEAQACGCPVVTTDRAPMTEVGGDAATYAPPGNPAALVQALEAALSAAPETRAAQVDAGLRNAARFSTSEMIRRYQALYHEICYPREDADAA